MKEGLQWKMAFNIYYILGFKILQYSPEGIYIGKLRGNLECGSSQPSLFLINIKQTKQDLFVSALYSALIVKTGIITDF